MTRIAWILVVGVAVGIGGLALAQPDAHPKENGEHVKVLATYDLKKKVDGKEGAVTMVEVSFGPGQAGASLFKNGILKVYEKFPHGMCTTHADVINADLLAFIKS
jgi:hypothetical protein